MEEIVKVLRAKADAAKAEAHKWQGRTAEMHAEYSKCEDRAATARQRARLFEAAATALEDTPASE